MTSSPNDQKPDQESFDMTPAFCLPELPALDHIGELAELTLEPSPQVIIRNHCRVSHLSCSRGLETKQPLYLLRLTRTYKSSMLSQAFPIQ